MISVIVEKLCGEFLKGCSGFFIFKIGYFGWKIWEFSFDEICVLVLLIEKLSGCGW